MLDSSSIIFIHRHTFVNLHFNYIVIILFTGLVALKRSNGVSFIDGKDNDKRCREFFGYIAKAMRGDIEKILKTANFFAGIILYLSIYFTNNLFQFSYLKKKILKE